MSDVSAALLKQLKNPFDPKFVKFRVGATNADKTKGIALAYIDSREVTKRLDDVCGVGGWQDRYVPVDGGFICEISILINGTWVTKSNAAGHTNVEPLKGGASDAFKRAASTWGIGRYLYYLPNVWVPIRQQGKSYTLSEIPELPDWAQPDKHVERWEDVAELEAQANSGADSIDVDVLVDNLDLIRAAKDIAGLDEVINKLSADERVVMANQINAKRRELQHASDIHTDSGASPAA
jgi:hypothetical protein